VSVTSFEKFIAEAELQLPDGGSAEFEPYGDDELELWHLAADKPGKGWGTEAMRLIVSLADKWKVPLMVIPAGVSKAESLRLERFYRRFGFEGEDALHRYPE
jgi:RimJ/RimL family protein N-acetyltransferase